VIYLTWLKPRGYIVIYLTWLKPRGYIVIYLTWLKPRGYMFKGILNPKLQIPNKFKAPMTKTLEISNFEN